VPTLGITQVPVFGDGPTPCDLMIVGEAPGKEEVKARLPFIGRSGDELWFQVDRWIKKQRDECYVTNAFLFPLEKEEKRITDREWEMAREKLRIEIEEVRPRVILALGAVAIHTLIPNTAKYSMETINGLPLNLSSAFAGSFYQTPDGESPIVIPSYHPAASFRDSSKLGYLINACKAAREVLMGRMKPQDYYDDNTRETSLDRHLRAVVALDTETLKSGKAYISSISGVEGEAACVMADDTSQINRIAIHIARPEVTSLLHNALFDLPVLESIGIYPNHWIDTMSVAFFLQYLPLGLKELAYRLMGMRMRTYEEVVGEYADLSLVPDRESVMRYARTDPDATLRLYNILRPYWYMGLEQNLQCDMEIQHMVIAMMKRGFKANREAFKLLQKELESRNFQLFMKVEQFAMEQGFDTPQKSGKNKGMVFNPRSYRQIQKLLYEKMKLGQKKNIKQVPSGGKSTNKKYLARITDESGVVAEIIKYKETATIVSSFAKKLPRHISKIDGRIHYDLAMTRILHSGRFASSKPNILGIPVRSDDGRRIRECFEAADGYTLASNDLSQIELRVMAHISQDPTMLDIYRTDRDIHTATGMGIFQLPANMLDDYKHRLPSKTINFGILNLISSQGLSRELISIAGQEWTEPKCQKFIDDWFELYPGVRKHLDRTRASILRYGYIEDMWGRREQLPQIYSCNSNTIDEGIRIGCNMLIQAGAQGLIKQAMRNLWKKHLQWWVDTGIAYCLIQIHDDLVFEIKDEYVGEVCEIIRYELAKSAPEWFSVPVKAETKVGKKWSPLSKLNGGK
jgi:DNA polymerase I